MLLFTTRRIWKDMKKRWAIMKFMSVPKRVTTLIIEGKNRISCCYDDITHKIVGDLISPSDFVVLVVPIDKAAPKGRLILPQQQTIRDILESDAVAIVVKENELKIR